MRSLINFEESDHYKWAVDYNEKNGLKSVVFATKTLTLEQADEYCKEYYAASKTAIDKEGRFMTLAKAMETNLELVGIVGFKSQLRDDAQPTVNLLKDMGVNVHILSGDNLEHNMMTVHQLGLIGKTDKEIVLNFQDEENGKTQIKKVLEMIHENLGGNGNKDEEKEKDQGLNPSTPNFRKARTLKQSSRLASKNLALIISGDAIEVINKDRYLYEHALFSFEFAKTVIGFDMSGEQKALVVKMFQSLQKTVMAVGDGFNDVNMIQQANVGFQMLDQNMGYQFGDIMVDNLISIVNAMKRDCRNWNNNLHMAVHYFFNFSTTLMCVSLYYQIYCTVTGSTPLNSYFTCYSMFFMVPMAIFFIFLNKMYPEKIRDQVPGLYCEKNYLTRRVDLRLLLFHMMPQSLIEAAMILILPIHGLYDNLRPDGSLENLHVITITVYLVVLWSFTSNLIVSTEIHRFLLTFIFACIWGLMFISYYFSLEVGLLESIYRVSIPTFFSSPNAVVLTISLALLVFLWNRLYWMINGHQKFYPVFNMIRRGISQDDDFRINLTLKSNPQSFLENFKYTDTFTITFRKSFNHDSSISPVITSLLVSDVEELKTSKGWFLNFRTPALMKNYAIFIDFRFSWMMKIVGIVSSVCLFLFLLLSYLIDPIVPYSSAWVYVFIGILAPLLYLFTFVGKWSVMAHAYAKIFQFTLLISSILYTLTTESTYSLLGTLIVVFISLHFTVAFHIYLVLVGISLAGFALNFVANIKTIQTQQWEVPDDHLIYPLLSLAVLYVAIVIASIFQRRKSEMLIKDEFTTNANLDSNSAKAKDLLSLLLPKFVLDKMDDFYQMNGFEKVIEDQADKGVTIIFCDISDFEEVVRKNENNIVQLLDRIFRKFDDLCNVHGIQKIETVGKTYMAASGLKDVEAIIAPELQTTNPSVRMLRFAKDLMEQIKNYDGLNLQIGIHIGKPVMGVIGYHKPQFSLIGDAVNTTSRHCTTGKKGRIMLSQEVWELVKDSNPQSGNFLIEVVDTEMKGKGKVPVYHLYPRSNTLLTTLNKIIQRSNPQEMEDSEMKRLVTLLKTIRMKQKIRQANKFIHLIDQLKLLGIGKYNKLVTTVKQTTAKPTHSQTEEDNLDLPLQGDSNLNGTQANQELGEINTAEQPNDEETEKLNPSVTLTFKESQYDLVRKYNKNLKDHNHVNLMIFYILLSVEYILQIVLHGIFSEDLFEAQRKVSVKYNSFVSCSDLRLPLVFMDFA